MGSDDQKRLTQETAARLWKRAAELQSEAARRLEATSRTEAESDAAESDTEGYALAHVRQAAEEAGISGEFVDVALAEASAQEAMGHHEASWLDRTAKRLLADPPEFLEARRVIPAAPETIYEAMQGMLPRAPYNLAVRDIRGDVLNRGVMVFDVPSVMAFSYTQFEYDMSHPGIKRILISIHPLAEASCEVVVRCPLQAGRRLAGGIFGSITGVAGLGGLVVGVGLGGAVGVGFGLAGLGLAPVMGGAALLGGGTLGGAARMGFRKLYRYGMRRGQRAMEGLLGALAVSVTSDWHGGGRSPLAEDTTAPGLLGDVKK